MSNDGSNGQAIFESDTTPPISFTHEDWPGFNNVELWETLSAEPALSDIYTSANPYNIELAPGVVKFCMMRLLPL